MNMKIVAGLAFFLNTVLFATYYALAKGALARIDPLMFTFFEMTTLAPLGLCILAFTWRTITTSLLKRGILLGSSLCLALFTIAIALGRSTASGTAFFPALNGFLAALFAWVVMRQPVRKATWCAGVLSLIGAVLLMINTSMGGMRGSVLAFLGGLFFTGYVFLADTQPSNAPWPLFGIELLTMATWASLIALLFGNWQAVHPELPKDALVILYVAGVCTFLPTLITITMQKYISVVTISFIYILEPILSAGVAMLYLHEMLPLPGYIGGGLVVAGAVIHTWFQSPQAGQDHTWPAAVPLEHKDIPETRKGQVSMHWGTAQRSNYKHTLPHPSSSMNSSIAIPLWSTAGYQLLCVAAIACILYGLGGFPPSSWRLVYTLGSKLLPLWEQGQHIFVALLVAQAACWLCAWVLLISVGCQALFRAVQVLFIESADAYMKEGWNERSVL